MTKTENASMAPKTSFEIEELIDEIDRLIVRNREGYLKTERLQEKQRVIVKHKIKEAATLEGHMKRIRLQEVARINKRINRLNRALKIYNDNIDLHQNVSERLEDQLAAGQSQITAAQIEELLSDHGELWDKHREMMFSAQAMLNPIDYPEDNLLKDPEIKEIALECGLDLESL